MYDRYQSQALATRLGIPLIYGVDAVHGHNSGQGATIFPHNIGLGCTRNPELVEAVARVTAREVAGTGIDWTFAPCIARGARRALGAHLRVLRRDARAGREHGAAADPRLQGSARRRRRACWPAPSTTSATAAPPGGKDQGDTRIVTRRSCARSTCRYVAAIKAGVGSVMVSFSSWNGVPMHGNQLLITDVLKGELGFAGFVVSDWAAIDQIDPATTPSDIEVAINAGIDMVMVPNKLPRLHRAPEGRWCGGPRAHGAHRRRRPPHPEAEVRASGCWSSRSPTAR